MFILITANLKFGYSRRDIFSRPSELIEHFNKRGYTREEVNRLYNTGELSFRNADFYLIKHTDFGN